jgi:hypothetical protein
MPTAMIIAASMFLERGVIERAVGGAEHSPGVRGRVRALAPAGERSSAFHDACRFLGGPWGGEGGSLIQVMVVPRRAALVVAAGLLALACEGRSSDDVSLSKRGGVRALLLHERVPDQSETKTLGPIAARVERGSAGYERLVRCEDASVVFKDEEGTGADRMMTPRLREKLERLARRVRQEWPELRLRVTEAWDERREHGDKSLHYEGRAADITTSDGDPDKLGRLAWLAHDAGLEWVLYEDVTHVHVSVGR